MPVNSSPADGRLWRTILAVLVVLTLGGVSYFQIIQNRRVADDVPAVSDAKAALRRAEYENALNLATQIISKQGKSPRILEIAAEAATKAGQTDTAVEYYQSLAENQRKLQEPPLGLFYAAEACRDSGRLTKAEGFFRHFLRAAPQHLLTHERLAFLCGISGRRWESIPHYSVLVQSGKATFHELVLFADLDRPDEQQHFLEECERKFPGDRIVQWGLASHSFWEGRTEDAISRLETILKDDSTFLAGQAMLGELLLYVSENRFDQWHRRLPSEAEDHPDIHFVRGLWARKHDKPNLAARCFAEALRRSPMCRRSTVQLAQQLRSLDHPAAKAFEERSAQLTRLTQLLDQVLKTEAKRLEPIREITRLLEEIGRIWEAVAWGIIAEQQFPDVRWARELFERVGDQLTPELPLVIDRENLVLRLDLSTFPEFDRLEFKNREPQSAAEMQIKSTLRFEASDLGPEFIYENGGDPSTPGARMFEQTGGGVAVLDFDRDQWPDSFFTQGGVWRTGKIQPEPPGTFTDRLFRNSFGGRAIDVTAQAGVVDRGFGQGVAAGDFDNDGFLDLYVANIGQNQLLRNNGDGTFSDVTDQAGLNSTDWTSSCVIVDLNADGIPDLFDVNYVTGDGVYEMICHGKGCSPSSFAAASDRLLIGRGDGSFVLTDPGAPEVNGKGLGVVVFEFHERGRPCLFIANDQVPNFMLRNFPSEELHNIRLENEAFACGVAFNQDGLPMASMGIAADDANGDGTLDFYVTTFKDEASLLLLQDEATKSFVDSATVAGLRASTLPFVGWGTQFLDADRDGHPDLVAVNGHVDDYRDQGGEYQMRPQFFQNVGGGRFVEMMGSQIGPYFDKKFLGRGLSRLDWDGDGLMDFVVSNINDQASLVLNKTVNPGHWISVRLVSRNSARDAIGSTVEVYAAGRVWRKQLVAGDGYMASNERVVQFGLGSLDLVDELVVRWPSGSESRARHLAVDGTLQLVESVPQGVFWRDPVRSTLVNVIDNPQN